MDSVICKNTDNFSMIEKQLYQIYPQYKGKIIFKSNGMIIDTNKNLEENKIYNNSIINLIKI